MTNVNILSQKMKNEISLRQVRQILDICDLDLEFQSRIGYLNNLLLSTPLRQYLSDCAKIQTSFLKNGRRVHVRRV